MQQEHTAMDSSTLTILVNLSTASISLSLFASSQATNNMMDHLISGKENKHSPCTRLQLKDSPKL
jgi:hypothetical protein